MLLHALMMQLRREQAVTKILHIRKARIPILKVGHSAPRLSQLPACLDTVQQRCQQSACRNTSACLSEARHVLFPHGIAKLVA